MLEDKWNAYAKTWSLPDSDRPTALRDLVSEDVTYTDPQTAITGKGAFSAHIGQFQRDVPGGYFEILSVNAHHDRTLANWRMCKDRAGEVMRGTSYATLNEAGQFTSFTGFY